jgi:hypothetical protein
MNPNQITATIHETSERAADWQRIFGRLDNIPLRSPWPTAAVLPEKGQTQIYLLDVGAITSDERQRLIDYIAGRFSLPRELVEQGLDATGVPIVAEELLVTIPAALAWSILDAEDDDFEDDDEGWLDEQLRPLGF